MLPNDDKRYAIETCRNSESVLKKWFKNKWHTISAFVGCVIIIASITSFQKGTRNITLPRIQHASGKSFNRANTSMFPVVFLDVIANAEYLFRTPRCTSHFSCNPPRNNKNFPPNPLLPQLFEFRPNAVVQIRYSTAFKILPTGSAPPSLLHSKECILASTLLISLRKVLTFFQATFTRRTSGHNLELDSSLSALNISPITIHLSSSSSSTSPFHICFRVLNSCGFTT